MRAINDGCSSTCRFDLSIFQSLVDKCQNICESQGSSLMTRSNHRYEYLWSNRSYVQQDTKRGRSLKLAMSVYNHFIVPTNNTLQECAIFTMMPLTLYFMEI